MFFVFLIYLFFYYLLVMTAMSMYGKLLTESFKGRQIIINVIIKLTV